VRITRVELDNIKSYRRASVPFQQGTTAVRGHNGAGKSTLVEAIGYALFDALNYDQAQFVREGEKHGTVTVTFISALDEREYQVVRRCGSGALWYVYDPELDERVVEQKADVTDFIRKHLRLETESKLGDLFNDALGVPQGTFTADFLLTPANRKKKFDTLLQVEDYRRAAENLNDTRNYLLNEERRADTRIADLERETRQLDTWRQQLAEGQQLAGTLATRLELLLQETEQLETRRDTLRQAEAELARLASEAQVAEAACAAAESRLADATARLNESTEAVQMLAETRADHNAHLAAQRDLASVRKRAQERDGLRQRHAGVSQQLAGARSTLEHARGRLEQAQQAEQRSLALLPTAEWQNELERARNAAVANSRQLEQAQAALARAEREAAALREDIAGSEREIARLELLRPLAAELEERRNTVTMYQSIRAQRTERSRRQLAIAAEHAKLAQSREKAERAAAKAGANVRKIREQRATAERVPELAAAHDTVAGTIRRLEARQEHHRLSSEQSSGGACPFLREPCMNIQRRGENSLTAYFDRLIGADELELAPLREQLTAAATELEHAQTVLRYVEQLPQYEEQDRLAQERLAEVEDAIARLEDERAQIEEWLRSAPGEESIAEAQTLFKRSDDADKQLRELAPRQAELRRARERLGEAEADSAAQQEAIGLLADAPGQAQAAEVELASLGDPRGEIAVLQATARERPQLETSVADLVGRVAALDEQVAALDTALLPYSQVDDEQRALEEELERTQPAHTRYLQHEQVAARLPACERAMATATAERDRADAVRGAAVGAHAAAAARFDAAELRDVLARCDALRAERATLNERLRRCKEDGEELRREIARVEALLDDLAAARQERAALEELERMLQQFRDTIKEAGPHIMKAVLRQISTEANRIFGEVIGDRSAQLSWESDYEIVLRRDGRERTFAQLSGGEQMSAALAVRLALLRRLTRLDIAFFDEPTQNMDDDRRGNLAEQIRRVRGFDQLIVISHDDTFEQGLDNVIHLEKRGGETVLVDEGALVPA